MTLLTIPAGTVAFDLPHDARFDEAPGPASGWIAFGSDRAVFYDLQVLDLTGVPGDEVGPLALHQALDEGEAIAAVPTQEGDLFRDVLTIEVKHDLMRRRGLWYLRLDRLAGGLVRILKVAPGRADGESRTERAAMDAIALDLARGARFAPEPMAFDRTAGRPGSLVLRLRERLFCPLPEGWTAHRPDEVDPDREPDEDEIPDDPSRVVCLAPEGNASMFVSVAAYASDAPFAAADLAEAMAGWREDDVAAVQSAPGMGRTVEVADLGPGRYAVHGAFDPDTLGYAGRHYVFRAAGPTRMVEATFSPLVTDDEMPPDEAAAVLADLHDHVMRAYLFVDEAR